MKYLLAILLLIYTSFLISQSNCNNFNQDSCIDSINQSDFYFFDLNVEDCNNFNFNAEVDKRMKEGLINKIITKIDVSSTLETSNVNGESSSMFSEKITMDSSGILFDINYLYCNKNNRNSLIAYVDKGIFNNSSKRSFENKLIILNSEIDLIFDQLIFNKEILFNNEVNKISNEVYFMEKNLNFLNNINIEYDLVYAFNNLKSKLGNLKSRLKTFDNMEDKVLNYLLNFNKIKANEEYKSMLIKFGDNPAYREKLKDLRKRIRKN